MYVRGMNEIKCGDNHRGLSNRNGSDRRYPKHRGGLVRVDVKP